MQLKQKLNSTDMTNIVTINIVESPFVKSSYQINTITNLYKQTN